MTSSWVMPRQRSCPLRSFSRNMLSPITSQRPDSCQTSAGFSAGSSISCAPMASISSRTIRMIFSQRALRQEQVAVDAGRKLADVARAQQQLWLGTSASAGFSRSVGMNSLTPMHRKDLEGPSGEAANSSMLELTIPRYENCHRRRSRRIRLERTAARDAGRPRATR